jgi:hypothetical protein
LTVFIFPTKFEYVIIPRNFARSITAARASSFAAQARGDILKLDPDRNMLLSSPSTEQLPLEGDFYGIGLFTNLPL